MTFGYKRVGKFMADLEHGTTVDDMIRMNKYFVSFRLAEVLGAIISILGIWILTTFLFYIALNRMLYQDFNIDADTMIIVSLIGIVINIL